MFITDIKKTVPPETEGLMNLEIQTNCSHYIMINFLH